MIKLFQDIGKIFSLAAPISVFFWTLTGNGSACCCINPKAGWNSISRFFMLHRNVIPVIKHFFLSRYLFLFFPTSWEPCIKASSFLPWLFLALDFKLYPPFPCLKAAIICLPATTCMPADDKGLGFCLSEPGLRAVICRILLWLQPGNHCFQLCNGIIAVHFILWFPLDQ